MERGIRHATTPLRVASFAIVAVFATIIHALAAPVTFQEGLPPALTIEVTAQPDGSLSPEALRTQAQALQKLADGAQQTEPKVGFFERLFPSPNTPRLVNVEDLATPQAVSLLRGQQVMVEGVLEHAADADGRIRTDRAECLVDLAEGTKPEGFPTPDAFGQPVLVQGMVESRGQLPVVRAISVKPSRPIALLRVARIKELLGDTKAALTAYAAAEAALRGRPGDYGAFCAVSAARIAYEDRDTAEAAKHYNAAWNVYVTGNQPGMRPHSVWVPDVRAARWNRVGLREAIADPLDRLNSENFWYRFVDLFVTLCGRNAALGVLLLSLVVRLIIWPLTRKQLQSAEAMKRLQPQIKELQARFADDKQRFQQEFWKLCQANGVNPLGGCLPLIIQMPLLIMVYNGIRLYIVQFDRASFLWIPRLSGPDLPLLVAYTISMILFQKMTQRTNPQAVMDPQQEQQQKMMMYLMPLMFFYMFRTFPAAFILYWLATNIIYFIQQWAYTRKLSPPVGEAPAQRPRGLRYIWQLLSGEPQPEADNPSAAPQQSHNVSEKGPAVGGQSQKKGKQNKKAKH
jgi:YidC/Oxa1 family membrane protein insertase